MSTSDWINIGIAFIGLLAVVCNIAIAFFTRSAALAAQRSAKLANEAAADSHKQAERMSTITLNAAKANALATRIERFGDPRAEAQVRGWNPALETARDQQEHLVYQLDEILDKLGAGLGQPCDGSPHNGKMQVWKEAHANALAKVRGSS
jgi:hypothetical protein